MAEQTGSSSTSSTPSGPKEETLLENYFLLLSQFAFDKAKELSEKDKDVHKLSTAASWGTIIQCLSQLAAAEKMYMSLTFLGQKRFNPIGRARENLRNNYQFLVQEFQRIDSLSQTPVTLRSDLDILLAHLSGQLSHYLTARQRLMDLYEQISSVAVHRNVSFDDLVTMVTDIIQAHSRGFHHPLLSPLKSSFSLECDVMRHLLEAQILMSEWQCLPSLLQLHQAHTKLASWANMAAIKEPASKDKPTPSKKGFVSTSKASVQTGVYHWLARFKGLLVAKFSLYFYEVLSKQAVPVEMKSWASKTTDDFIGKITSFQKKCDAFNVSLVLDSHGLKDTYKGPGYHHPNKITEAPEGLNTFPAILSIPGERPTSHWPNVVMMISDKNTPDLSNQDKVNCFYDKRAQSTYFISRVDPRIYLVVVFETKKSEKDSYVTNFMNDLSLQLRCSKILSSLKPGSK
ncbi:KICSTOR subunit 2-like isoform X1 [Haliotis rufescens]|uniref:KICSTOR subunit 2-like isoform X1 n=1 Tax=Haliotis rufescens TaxID=6454 RepID=UPI001EB00D25|nr:KICSTOR subunit 2-like isoform X1 [Haliotis rufescens]XP_046350662.1 KICSTOR subunit 2-like isoform X1 [Haliotis rufescens]